MTRPQLSDIPGQSQEWPGTVADLDPAPDHGEESWTGRDRLPGRRALITGGDSGIGAATAIAFAREGADVVITYLPEEEKDARNVLAVLEKEGRTAVGIAGDLRDRQFCQDVVAQAVEAMDGLDVLVNNGGKQVAQKEFEAIDDEQLEATFDVNILAQFRLVRAALPHLKAGASIINTTSVVSYMPPETLIDYASTKAAINNFTKGLGQQLAPKGIRVNAVAPGPIWTPLQPSGGQPTEELPDFGKSTPLGRAGQPTELAPAFVFLASAESSYVVGATIAVTGGMPTP